jgi:Holliday junction resolvasome RuvABC endonuclease subunit
MTSGKNMIVSVGIDVGTQGAIAAINGDNDIMFVSSWDLSKFSGVVRLRELQKVLYENIMIIQKNAAEDDAIIVSIEEPPNVKNHKTYCVLSQMLGVAQVAVYNLTNTIPLIFNTSTWKQKIGAAVAAPVALRGKKNQAERQLHMKDSVQRIVLRRLCERNKNNLRKVITSSETWRLRTDSGADLDSDAYDALGIASAGLCELENVSLDV